jgi:hypothetical protein
MNKKMGWRRRGAWKEKKKAKGYVWWGERDSLMKRETFV